MRRGVASSEIIVLLVAAISIGSVAAFVGPRLLRAGQTSEAEEATVDPVLDGVRRLIESSTRIFAVEHEPLTGDTFVVLWGGDPEDTGKIGAHGVIDQQIFGVFLIGNDVGNAGRDRHRRDTGRPDQRINLGFQK